jgi:hypothetical protein
MAARSATVNNLPVFAPDDSDDRYIIATSSLRHCQNELHPATVVARSPLERSAAGGYVADDTASPPIVALGVAD